MASAAMNSDDCRIDIHLCASNMLLGRLLNLTHAVITRRFLASSYGIQGVRSVGPVTN